MKLTECFFILIKVFDVVCVHVDVALLQKTVKLKSRKPEEPACLIVRKRAGALPLDDQGFEGFTARILVLGQIVGKLDGYLPI